MTRPEGDTQVVNTEHGQLKVPVKLLGLWDKYGWPRDDVLAEMSKDERWKP